MISGIVFPPKVQQSQQPTKKKRKKKKKMSEQQEEKQEKIDPPTQTDVPSSTSDNVLNIFQKKQQKQKILQKIFK